MADLTLPPESEALVLEDRRANTSWYRVLVRLVKAANEITRSLSDTDAGVATKAAKTQDWSESLIIEFPEDKTYPFPAWFKGEQITSVITQCLSGTCTATVKIGSTALGGSANSVSSVRQTQAHTTANQSADSDDLNVTISANASCEALSMTLRGTRVLD